MLKRLALTIVAIAFLAGCESPTPVPYAPYTAEGQYLPGKTDPGLVAKIDSPIPDVPIPIGFKPYVSRCSSSFDGHARQVKHVYQGRANTAEVVNFYRTQLPRHDWPSPTRYQDELGAAVLESSKGPENLRVRVHKRFDVVTIVVSIVPKSPATGPANVY